jgi:NAD(P)-dependent dehydrogenase (short-subunit alcohol dehydrogenase family)
MKDFKDKVAVITGAASGLGREFARAAAGLGMKLVLGDIDGTALEQVSGELQDGGAEVLAMVCDVRKCAHVEELADAAMIRFHAVHLLFNNAGIASGGLLWEHTENDWDWVVGTNLGGAIHGVRLFTPLMLACAARDPDYEGHIVNSAGLPASPALGACRVAASGLAALTEALYQDLRLVDAPVGVSLLAPGTLPTAFDRSWRHRPPELADDDAPTASQQAARALLERAVALANSEPAEVVRLTFEAIRAGRYDALGHGAAPQDPYAAQPEFLRMLRAEKS